MVLVALGELAVHDRHLFAVDRRGETVVVPCAVKVAVAVRTHPKDLRVLVRHPGRSRAARRREHGVCALGGKPVHDIVHPVESEPAFLRFKRRPGEDADAHGVAAGELHEPEVLVDDLRHVQPLVGVVVAAVQHGPAFCDVLFHHAYP